MFRPEEEHEPHFIHKEHRGLELFTFIKIINNIMNTLGRSLIRSSVSFADPNEADEAMKGKIRKLLMSESEGIDTSGGDLAQVPVPLSGSNGKVKPSLQVDTFIDSKPPKKDSMLSPTHVYYPSKYPEPKIPEYSIDRYKWFCCWTVFLFNCYLILA